MIFLRGGAVLGKVIYVKQEKKVSPVSNLEMTLHRRSGTSGGFRENLVFLTVKKGEPSALERKGLRAMEDRGCRGIGMTIKTMRGGGWHLKNH